MIISVTLVPNVGRLKSLMRFTREIKISKENGEECE